MGLIALWAIGPRHQKQDGSHNSSYRKQNKKV
jgi:hypothetical protein